MARNDDEIFRVLCGTLGHGGVPASFASPESLNSRVFAALITLAEQECVLPALYDALAVRQGAKVAKPVRAVCAVHNQTNRRRNHAIRAVMLELGEAAAAAGLEFVVLKGAAWAIEDAGGAAAWRSMLDIDVLVEPSRFDEVPEFLERLGYVRLSNSARYHVNFHHAPYARPDGPAMIEVHSHLGWRHQLMAPAVVFQRAHPIAKGLLLPAPWCRAFHTIVHWQFQDFGISRATMRVKDMLDIDRFLSRSDVDWAKLAAHARAVGATQACEAALALAGHLFGSPYPREMPLSAFGKRHVELAVSRKSLPWRAWIAREKWRAGTLWRCEKIAYRWAIKGAHPITIQTAVWAGRLVRLPHLFIRAVGIMLRALTMLVSERSQRRHLARAR